MLRMYSCRDAAFVGKVDIRIFSVFEVKTKRSKTAATIKKAGNEAMLVAVLVA